MHPLLCEWSMQMLKKIHAREIEERYDRAEMQHTSLEELTKKFIEVKPYPWLEKLEKNAKKIAPEIDKGFNRDLQEENDRKSALYSEWWGSINQVLTLYRDGISRLLHDLLSK